MNSPRFEQPHSEDLRFVCQAGEHDVWIDKDHKKLIARNGNDPCDYGIMNREVFRTMVKDLSRKHVKTMKLSRDLNEIPYYKVWTILLDNPEWSGTI